MNRRSLLYIFIVLTFGGGLTQQSSAEPDAPTRAGRCRLYVHVVGAGASETAKLELIRRADRPRYLHGYHWTADATLRELRLLPTSSPVLSVEVPADRRVVMDGLAPGEYLVRAHGDEGRWGAAAVPFIMDGQHQHALVRLREASEQLKGKLIHSDGSPFRGHVLVSRHTLSGGWRARPSAHSAKSVPCASDGTFSVSGLPKAQVWITAVKPGAFRRVVGSHVLPAERELTFVVDAPGHVMRGRVVDIETGRPLARARVIWEGQSDRLGGCSGVAKTANDGAFKIVSPTPVSTVHIRAPDYAERRFQGEHLVSGRAYGLRKGQVITGRVFDAHTNDPISGLSIRRVGPGAYSYQWTWATSNAAGLFRMPIQTPGGGRLHARGGVWIPLGLEAGSRSGFMNADRYPRVDPLFWLLSPGHDLQVEIPVVRGAELRGRVLTHAGEPVVGVPIIDDRHSDPLFAWTGRPPPPMAITDAEGRFHARGLLPGEEYEPEAYPPFRAVATAKVRLGDDPSDANQVVLRLPAPFWVEVRVEDADTSEPIVSAEISSNRTRRIWLTDERGIARVGPLRSTHDKITAWLPGYGGVTRSPKFAAGDHSTALTIALRRERRIQGRVRHADGRPAAGAVVYGANGSTDPDDFGVFESKTRCGADGRFLVELEAADEFLVRAVLWQGSTRYAASSKTSGEEGDVVLTLVPVPSPRAAKSIPKNRGTAAKLKPKQATGDPEHTARVILVEDPAGRPIPSAAISAPWVGQLRVRDGRAELPEYWTSDGAFEVWGATAEDGVALPVGSLLLKQLPESEGMITLTLPPERVIQGRVVGPGGEPVPRVWIKAHPVRLGTVPRLETGPTERSSAMSDARGRFRLGSLGSEQYALKLTMPQGWLPPLKSLRLSPSSQPVELRLRRAISMTVTVRDPLGVAVAGAHVSASRGAWSYFWRRGWSWQDHTVSSASTDRHGRCILQNLDPSARHTIRVAPPEGTEALEAASTEHRPSAEIALTLRHRQEIRGRVREADGRDVDGRIRILWRTDGPWHQNETNAVHGKFAMHLPVRGRVELAAVVGLMDAPTERSSVARSETGATDVVLTLTRGKPLQLLLEGITAESVESLVVYARRVGAPADVVAPHYFASSDRLVTIPGADPDASYEIWITRAAGGMCAHVRGVRWGAKPQVVRLERGLSVSGKFQTDGDSGARWIRAQRVGGGPLIHGEMLDGRYAIDGLTDGEWRITATAVVGDREVRAKAVVRAGTTYDLILRP